MTCVVGLVENGEVWLGCDSFVGNRYYMNTTREPKVRKKVLQDGTPILFGFSGDVRASLLLDYFALPEYSGDPRKYVGITLIDQIRSEFKDAGYLERNNEVENQDRATIMVGLGGRLFTIQHQFNVVECRQPYQAIGSGNEVALGALSIVIDLEDAPIEKLERVLKAVEGHSPFVQGPFAVIGSTINDSQEGPVKIPEMMDSKRVMTSDGAREAG